VAYTRTVTPRPTMSHCVDDMGPSYTTAGGTGRVARPRFGRP
jgi:hypothetical protein